MYDRARALAARFPAALRAGSVPCECWRIGDCWRGGRCAGRGPRHAMRAGAGAASRARAGPWLSWPLLPRGCRGCLTAAWIAAKMPIGFFDVADAPYWANFDCSGYIEVAKSRFRCCEEPVNATASFGWSWRVSGKARLEPRTPTLRCGSGRRGGMRTGSSGA